MKNYCTHCGSLYEEPTPNSLRKLRQKNGVTMNTLATYLGVSPAYLSLVETGHARVTPRIAKGYQSILAQ